MLDTALKFLVGEANSYLRNRGLAQSGLGEVILGQLVDDAGKWSTVADNVGFTLVNVEEDRIMRSQLPSQAFVNGRNVTIPPELKLNLTVLAHVRPSSAERYEQSLRFLSNVMTFFQAHSSFAGAAYPALDPSIEALVVEMLALTSEQLNQLWTYLGSKYLPSAAYRVRMVILQDVAPQAVTMPIMDINGRLNSV
jgi:hypothetical protein